jgi:hypothetical protein
VENYEFD